MPSTEEVLRHHSEAFGTGNVDEFLADYTDDSILFTPEGATHGLASLRPVFTALLGEFSKPGGSFTMHKQIVEGDIAYLVWSAETADNVYELASDTFVIRDGKIIYHTFVAKMTPKS